MGLISWFLGLDSTSNNSSNNNSSKDTWQFNDPNEDRSDIDDPYDDSLDEEYDDNDNPVVDENSSWW